MDTSGIYPKLGDDDPLFEIAAYTQAMADALKVYGAVVGTVNQSIPNAAWTKVTFSGIEDYNAVTLNLAGGTITTTKAGFYVISATAGTAGTSTGAFGIRLLSGSTVLGTHLFACSPAGTSGAVTTMAYLAVGAALSFDLYQSSGAARTTTSPRFSIARIGG